MALQKTNTPLESYYTVARDPISAVAVESETNENSFVLFSNSEMVICHLDLAYVHEA